MYILSWVTVLVRVLKEVHPFMVNLSFGFIGMVVQGTIAYFTNSLEAIEDGLVVLLCAATAVCATLGNLGYNIALQTEQAGIVSLVRTTEVIFSFVYQYLLFGIQPKAQV